MTARGVAFDIIGTLFSLETQRPRLVAAGLPPHALERWIAATLRDLFALGAIGRTATMRALLEDHLLALLAEAGAAPDRARIDAVLDGMASLDPRPGAEAALRRIRDAGFATIALSNGGLAATTSLLARSGLAALFDAVLSIDEVGQPKPCAPVYHAAAVRLGLDPARLTLVASHPWDIQGALDAGLAALYVPGPLPYPSCFDGPSAEAPDLIAAAALLASS